MPYVVAKGRLWNIVEDYLSSRQNCLDYLAHLEAGNPVWEAGALDSIGMPGADEQGTRDHVRDDWVGLPQVQLQAGPGGGPPLRFMDPRGWWDSWYGPSEEILRETLIRAIRISLCLGRLQAPDQQDEEEQTEPPMPIEILWVCGEPGFPMQGWISWRNDPPVRRVTVVIVTPKVRTGDAMYSGVANSTNSFLFSNGLNADTLHWHSC